MRSVLHPLALAIACLITTPLMAAETAKPAVHEAKVVKVLASLPYAPTAAQTRATPLDEVPGVGAARQRALLAHFGSAKAVSRANLADLKAVEGISGGLAERIYDFFHER